VLTEAVDNEVFNHLRMGTMALLPTPEVLEKLCKLYEYNFDENLPAHEREFFLKVGLLKYYILAHSLLEGSPI